MPRPPCPSITELLQYHAHKLAPEQRPVVEAHQQECSQCRMLLRTIAGEPKQNRDAQPKKP